MKYDENWPRGFERSHSKVLTDDGGWRDGWEDDRRRTASDHSSSSSPVG